MKIINFRYQCSLSKLENCHCQFYKDFSQYVHYIFISCSQYYYRLSGFRSSTSLLKIMPIAAPARSTNGDETL